MKNHVCQVGIYGGLAADRQVLPATALERSAKKSMAGSFLGKSMHGFVHQ
jgi:hypothetical protein